MRGRLCPRARPPVQPVVLWSPGARGRRGSARAQRSVTVIRSLRWSSTQVSMSASAFPAADGGWSGSSELAREVSSWRIRRASAFLVSRSNWGERNRSIDSRTSRTSRSSIPHTVTWYCSARPGRCTSRRAGEPGVGAVSDFERHRCRRIVPGDQVGTAQEKPSPVRGHCPVVVHTDEHHSTRHARIGDSESAGKLDRVRVDEHRPRQVRRVIACVRGVGHSYG
jgi:hypothetical protein